MSKEFQQIRWSAAVEPDLQRLLEIAVSEDTESVGDLTSMALIPAEAKGAAALHVRQRGVIAGIAAVQTVMNAVDKGMRWEPATTDGTVLEAGELVGMVVGPARSLLTAERLVLNLLGRLSGIATLTKRYVDAVSGTNARIYDTRKTTLGWRRLEKYAVQCGGGRNHRTGLFDAILIKDNHLALGKTKEGTFTSAEAVKRVRDFLYRWSIARTDASMIGAHEMSRGAFDHLPLPILEIEVDTLDQLREVLVKKPDIVLLDNMKPAMLAEAVAIRNDLQPECELEASGGVNLETVRAIAETGVERISVGALTHSAVSLDLGLDWNEE